MRNSEGGTRDQQKAGNKKLLVMGYWVILIACPRGGMKSQADSKILDSVFAV